MLRILRTCLVPGTLILAAVLGACFSGGGSGGGNASEFSLVSCSLGCGHGTCAVTSIAVNQDIVLTFNDEVDPATVSFTTLQILQRDNGTSPVGQFLVDGNRVIFRPALIETPTGVLFGFEDGADYLITLFAAPESAVIRSTIGRPNTTPIVCTVRTEGVADLVPGRPRVSFTPDAAHPPTSREFDITMVFNDLMQRAQLVDPVTGESPTIRVVVVDSTTGQTLESEVPGTFTATLDRDSLTTTVVFHPAVPFPGSGAGFQGGPPLRQLRLDFASQIADLAGNTLENSGSFLVPLPDTEPRPGSFQEDFLDFTGLDPAGSTAGLWAAVPGFLDSGLDPVTGVHHGGGSGVLGTFAPEEDFVFDTDDMTLAAADTDNPLGMDLRVVGGVFMFDEIHIPAGVTVRAQGSRPLRLFSRGQFVVEGTLDLSGEDAPPNFGKYFPPGAENVVGEDEGNMNLFEAFGAEGGQEKLGGGRGGRGGAAWYTLPDYYNEALPNFQSGNPDPNRFQDGLISNTVHGHSGQGVGGRRPLGTPLARAAQVAVDRSYGSGIGSLAWPPESNLVLDDGLQPRHMAAHQDPVSGIWLNHALHRARGGGGGGFWTDGLPGMAFDPTGTDPLGLPLVEPVADPAAGVFEYNAFLDFDQRAGGGTPDGAGGRFDPALYPGIETLDPEAGLLLGGAGGGGAGSGEHGSWSVDPANTDGAIDTYRNGDGAGGGAGGGAVQIQVGGRAAISGAVSVEGGDGGSSAFMLEVPYSPANAITIGKPGDAGGGGGSGGSILFQVNGNLDEIAPDSLRLAGGKGGLGSAGNHGGDGGAGLIRFETLTGLEGLSTLQALVDPDASVDLAPIGQPGVPNVTRLQAIIPGDTGDGTVVTGNGSWTFNGNASGVRSLWYAPDSTLSHLSITGWRVVCRYDDGSGEQVEVFDQDHPTEPGVTPIWVAFQTGWGMPAFGQPVEPDVLNPWVVPGFDGIGGGLARIQSHLWRMIRFQIVFDMDLVRNTRTGTAPGAYYRVDQVVLEWSGD